ncbi:MAG: ATP-binding cassette domain-containing protein, partial [Calditrichaeota bacterium]|nr:ATP-binding cassette domain-containing protein [Calditrichota bacterium]
ARMSLDPDWDYTALSGGQKRRVLLAAALVSEPDLLLLDEPTNHLDITTIAWMEEFLLRENLTLLFVTHDRMLLRRLATRIVELDNGVLYDWSCDYDTFLQRKQALLDAQEKEWARFDKKLAQEEVWIRQGIKARRTRNEGRVRALKQMREARRKRRQAPGSASMKLAEAQQSGNLVIEAQGLAYSYDNQPLIQDFSTIITRGDKIGIIGPNGCGKTTLLNLLLGYLAPHAGTVRHGTNLAIRYYDQLREQIDESKTVWENVLPNGDTVTINGNSKHIIPYLQDFLFTPDRAKTPVTHLSGGERNRLLLARLFTQPANLLVLDEPTNDLDAETLELLEELLVNFQGTLLLISHDRTFLNNVVTSTLVFEGEGRIAEYVGGYDDWIEQQQRQTSADGETDKIDKKALYLEEKKARQKKKLSFKEAREMEALPGMIESLEAEQAQLQGKLADHTFYQDKSAVAAARARLAELETALAETYARWEYLESLSS